jgi:hypothetical protein
LARRLPLLYQAFAMTDHPYSSLPDEAFWSSSVASVPASEVDPVGRFALRIDAETKVATAGSCFAQHIARHLRDGGFNHFVPEPGHPLLDEATRQAHNYSLFSCRYGNIYTTRQLLQLMKRAYARFSPQEDVWVKAPDVVLDPFRPRVQPGGFISEAEMRADRAQHLAAVRRMFETLDVFVFTLGLTECWRSRVDGAVFPLCPGVVGGEFDSDKHEFYNQPLEDVVADLVEFRQLLRKANPGAQMILTVSPVPLIATAEPGEQVLSATTYSKSALRVAAETLRRRFNDVHYFPSYEVITGAFNRGAYFAADLRNVVEDGVEHVMKLFMRHVTQGGAMAVDRSETVAPSDYLALAERLIDIECDEVALESR